MSVQCHPSTFHAAIRTIYPYGKVLIWAVPARHFASNEKSIYRPMRPTEDVNCFSKPLQSSYCPEHRTVRRGCPGGLKWAEVKCILVSSLYVVLSCCVIPSQHLMPERKNCGQKKTTGIRKGSGMEMKRKEEEKKTTKSCKRNNNTVG